MNSSSGARHSRSSSLMSYEEDEGGSPSYDLEPSGRQPGPSHVNHNNNYYGKPSYGAAMTTTTTTTTTTTAQRLPQATLKQPPAPSRSSLIDDDDDEDDYDGNENDTYRYGSRAASGQYGLGGSVRSMSGYPSAGQGTAIGSSWGNTTSNGMGQTLLPGVGYGMSLPPDDQKGQRKERRSLMPDQPVRTTGTGTPGRKGPPNNNLYPRKDPPSKPPVSTVDFGNTIAMLTAQIDQPDEETLMTQHAQQTLLEIQHTTGVRPMDDNDAMNGGNGGEMDSTTENLPSLSEARKYVSSIFSRRIQKPLEPNTLSRRLRRPPSRELPADIMMGLSSGSITNLDHRLICHGCGVPLVSAKAAILVICPHCHGRYPNHRAGHMKTPAPPVQKEWSC